MLVTNLWSVIREQVATTGLEKEEKNSHANKIK